MGKNTKHGKAHVKKAAVLLTTYFLLQIMFSSPVPKTGVIFNSYLKGLAPLSLKSQRHMFNHPS